ncbi:MAG: hypothetical protein V4693_00565 [Pseudomonadota bacterium]
MSIDNRCDQNHPEFPGSQTEAHCLIALEQSALYAARLAISRWINESAASCAALESPAPALARSVWLAEAQDNFQQWLGRGGFAQYELSASNDSEAPSSLEPHSTSLPGPSTYRSDTCVD